MLLENTEELRSICLNIFNQSRDLSLLFVMPIFLARIAWLNSSGANQTEYSSLIKGLVAFFVLAFGFEYILSLVFEIPKALRPSFSSIKDAFPESSWVPDMLRWILESLGIIFYHIAHLIQFVFLVLLCSLAPVVFLLGSLFGIGLGVKVFFGLLLITGCCPIVWASFDQVGSFIYQMDISWMGYALSEILINFMKAFGPLGLAIAAFSSEVGGTIKKGFGAVAMVSTPTAKVGAFVGSGAAAVSYVGVSKAKEKITRLRTQKTNRNGWKVGSE
jgi:hypothetical protein